MTGNSIKYTFSNYSILLTVALSFVISWMFRWPHHAAEVPVNFMGGDAKDYYSALVSTFITHDLANQAGNDWFLLKTTGGTINVHPIGVSVLLLPFFAIACLCAFLFNAPLDGYSLPFQASVALAALCYAVIGLVYIKKLFQLHHIGDKITALILLLVFFGTNLLNYTLSEAGMSHVYSFSLISVFLYHSSKFVLQKDNRNLLFSLIVLGLIVLVRPNNVLILFSVFIWFKNAAQCKQFFAELFKNKAFYLSAVLSLLVVLSQSMVWFIQSRSLFHNTYKADGFYWSDPQIFKMLFGFDGGFFIYAPLMLVFLTGLAFIYRQSRFSFFAAVFFILGLFYFFASYWAYTYFDGLGIRVLVDYYALFSFIGAKFYTELLGKTLLYNSFVTLSAMLVILNLVYTYQANHNILLRAGMTYTKWKYIFLRTGKEYQDVLGGSNELKPYSNIEQRVILQDEVKFDKPFDYTEKDYGVVLAFDSVGFQSNRIQVKINVSRKELQLNASKDALLCISHEDARTHESKSFTNFRLNEAPARDCCDTKEYNYTANVSADFKAGDKLSVFIWNIKKQAFEISKFSVQVYNYGFEIN